MHSCRSFREAGEALQLTSSPQSAALVPVPIDLVKVGALRQGHPCQEVVSLVSSGTSQQLNWCSDKI